MDPGTGLTILGTAVGSAKLVEKILGPTADYLGAGLRDWTEQSTKNLGRIFRKAQTKLGDRLDHPGAVPPKVLKNVLQEGAFCDDELAAEYFGGVLASSRTEVGRDDRGAAFAAPTGRLTSYQIRSHFFFYTMVRVIFEGMDINIGVAEGRSDCRLFVPFNAYAAALDFSEAEDPGVITSHVMFGLSREALIDGAFQFGDTEHLKGSYPEADDPGLLFAPSALGVELYLWAHGRGDLPVRAILDSSVALPSEIPIATAPGTRSTKHHDKRFPKPESPEPAR